MPHKITNITELRKVSDALLLAIQCLHNPDDALCSSDKVRAHAHKLISESTDKLMNRLAKIQEKHYSEKKAGHKISEQLEYMNSFAEENYTRLAELVEDLMVSSNWKSLSECAATYFEVKSSLATSEQELSMDLKRMAQGGSRRRR